MGQPQGEMHAGQVSAQSPVENLRRRVMAGALTVLAAATLGCTTVPAALKSIDARLPERLSGRLAVQIENDAQRSFSAAFELSGDARAGELSLSSPLGTRLAFAHWDSDSVVLETSDSTRLFPDLDALASEMFSEPVPLRALIDWLKARPWPDAPSSVLPAPAAGFAQLGWDIRLDRWADGLVVATRHGVPLFSVRARLDRP